MKGTILPQKYMSNNTRHIATKNCKLNILVESVGLVRFTLGNLSMVNITLRKHFVTLVNLRPGNRTKGNIILAIQSTQFQSIQGNHFLTYTYIYPGLLYPYIG